jgi:hypothetical protein
VAYGTRAISEFNVALGRYVVMPDHLHFFVRGDQNFVLGNWSRQARLYNFVPGIATSLPAIAEAPRRRVSPCRQRNASTQRGGYNLSR